jgi:putative ABC transport system substrate-binding protein
MSLTIPKDLLLRADGMDSVMKRRAFLLAVGALVAARAQAQPAAKVARVAYLSYGTAATEGSFRGAVNEGLRALGWIEGRNLLIEERYAETRTEDLPRLVADLLRFKPDVIVCFGPTPAMALKNAGVDIPVVFVVVYDPIRLGLAKSLAHPEGNFTGLATAVPEDFFGKQLDLLREIVPHASRLAVLRNPGNPMHVANRGRGLKMAREHGFTVVEFQATTSKELEMASREAARQKADALFVAGDTLAYEHRQRVADLALKYRLPTVFLFRAHVEAGGLMSYGTDLMDLYRRAGGYVDKILKGAKPADLPIEQPTKFELVINLKTAKALGITVPQSVLLRADEVIQ